MHYLAPRGTPDPESDRRFAEAAFPLLEPIGWQGERHRGGYGYEGRERVTLSLSLVFGPWTPEPDEPRIAIAVGRLILTPLDERETRWMLWNRLGRPFPASPRMPEPGEMAEIKRAVIVLDGAPTEFTILERDAAWLAQGSWNEHAIELEADHVAPQSVRLQRASAIPDR